MKETITTQRIKDIVILFAFSLAALIISFFLSDVFPGRYKIPFIYLWYILIAFVVFISFLESRDNDPFVTGKTQTMGVMNSFVGAGILMIVLSKDTASWAIYSVIIVAVMFGARETGRQSRVKFEAAYLGKVGVLQSDLHNKGKAVIDGRYVNVWDKEEIPAGTKIQITEIIGRYLYVTPTKM